MDVVTLLPPEKTVPTAERIPTTRWQRTAAGGDLLLFHAFLCVP